MTSPWKRAMAAATMGIFYLGSQLVSVEAIPHHAGRQQALHHLFQSLDKDGDGQIEVGEVLKYIQVRQDSSNLRVDGEQDAAEHFMAIDSNDGDSTVSEQELLSSLASKLSGTSVENWVHYGLGLPQYRDNFIRNAVTVLDFPLFLEQQQLLEQELQITSVLHQRQILRSMHAIVLGIGSTPHAVHNVRHEVDDTGAMLVAWDAPQTDSNPPIRQHTISRSCLGSGCHWEVVGSAAADGSYFHDTTFAAQPTEAQYRVATWSAVGRSPHSYSVALAPRHRSSPQQFLDSVGVDTRPSARQSTPWPAMPPGAATASPPPPPPLSRALPRDDDEDEESTFVRSITGVVVTAAAAGLLLQLFWTGAPLPVDPTDPGPLLQDSAASDDAAGASDGDAAPENRTLRSMRRSALRLSRRTLSWIQSVGVGGVQAGGSGHSSSSDRTRATSGRSELTAGGCEDVVQPGVDPSGSMHALSAQDIITVGAPVTTPVPANRASPGWSNSGIRSRHAGRATVGDTAAGARLSPEAPSPGSGRVMDAAPGSQHRSGTASPKPSQRHQTLQRPRSYEGLPSGAAGAGGGGPRLVRRAHKALEKCNIQGCPYRPRGVVAALLRPTAEFHYCYRCQRQFCVNHMAWVTHGKTALGNCPLDARCICELCWDELKQLGQPLPTHGRHPAKTASFYAHTSHGKDHVAGSSVDSPVMSPAVTSPRSVGSDDQNVNTGDDPHIAARQGDAEQQGQVRADQKLTAQSSKARSRFRWPFKKK